MKHFSSRTNRLERCTAQTGACRYSVHGNDIPDVDLLKSVADEAAASGDVGTYLEVRRQVDALEVTPPVFDEQLPSYRNAREQEFFEELRSRYATVAKGRVEFQLTAEDNSYSFYCLRCYGPMKDLSDGDKFKALCSDCGVEQDAVEETGVLLRRSELLFFNEEETARASWYHSTASPDWGEAVESGRIGLIHAGSLVAASDRSSHNQFNGEVASGAETWVHELRLKPGVTVDPTVHGEDPEYSVYYREGRYGVSRYMNLYEDPGSVSLLVAGDQFEVVRKYQLE